MKRLRTILQSRYLLKGICLCAVIYSLLLILFFPYQSKYQGDETKITGIITKYKIEEEKITIYLKAQETILVNYYEKDKNKRNVFFNKLELGQTIVVTGSLKIPSNNTIPNQFNYKNYLKYKKIFYIMNATSLEIQKNNVSVFYAFKNLLTKRIDNIDQTGYLRTFILGDKSKIGNEIEVYQKNGISHLFSISGMHVSLITGVLLFFLKKITYSNYYRYGVVSFFLIIYLFLTDVSASILRTTIMFFLFSINHCFRLKIKSLDIMLLTLALSLVVQPFLLCDVGFQFSYLISTTLVLERRNLQKIKSKFLQSLYLSFLCFIMSLPICLYHFGKINLLSIVWNLIMIPTVSSIIFPMSFLVLVFPFFVSIYEKLIWILENINSTLSTIDFLELSFFKPNIMVVFIYGIIVGIGVFHKKFWLILVIILILHKCYPNLDSQFLVTILDVGQGDAIFIKFPFEQGNILIDTGGAVEGVLNQTNRIANNKLIPYFRSLGISELDYLILTHGDYDHMGESIDLVNNFKVNKVIFNDGEYNDLELELIKILEEKNIKYYQNIEELNINNNKLYFLNNKLYDNENDNSSIIYFNYNDIKMLFMGDAGVEVEKDLLEKYNLEDITILKVGHHGSKTSSSKKFIGSIHPKYSIISVGKNNKYGHPNNEVLANLTSSTIYRTDQDGSIMFRIKNSKLELEIYAP